MPSRTRGGDAVDGANHGTSGSPSGYVPGSFTVSETQVAIVDVRHLAGPQFGRFTPVGLQLITSSWDIGSDGEYGSGPKAGPES